MKAHDLPVYRERSRILECLSSSQVMVVESPTGSGKTTQIPLILHEAGYAEHGKIGVTQPRRIAAVSVCDYIARQTGSTPPDLVGFKMRFDDQTDRTTRIKIMTDGILLQEMKANPGLDEYSVIVVDEAHERSLNIDFILGLLKTVLRKRPEFRLIISSATINSSVFSQYFDDCPVLHIDSPMYPVEVRYTPPPSENSEESLLYRISTVMGEIVESGHTGDALIFLSGEMAIKNCVAELSRQSYAETLHILPLYGRLSREEQERVFDPPSPGKRKVVVSTNIAETSVTIEGITAVIDSGLAKLNFYNPKTSTSSLIEGPISRASANQRKGRAGRTQPGVCYRLYSEKSFNARDLFTTEEIYRTDLSEVVLRMAELDIRDFASFDFLSAPSSRALVAAVETLELLEALDNDNGLTEIGSQMARFPLSPRHSRMIVEAIHRYPDVIEETVIAAAFLTSQSPFILPEGEEIQARQAHHTFRHEYGDFASYLRLLGAYDAAKRKDRFCSTHYLDPRAVAEIRNVATQLGDIVSDMGVPLGNGGRISDYLCAVATGLIQFVCVRDGKFTYASLTAERIQIHPGSVMFRETPDYIVAGEIVRTSKTFARSVSPLERSWLSRISRDLAIGLKEIGRSSDTGRKGKSGKKESKKRDTTWQVSIAGRTFPIRQQKGKKKTVVVSWEALDELSNSRRLEVPAAQGNIRCVLTYRGVDLIAGEKLETVLRLARHIRLPDDLGSNRPLQRSYTAQTDLAALLETIPECLTFAPLRKSKKQLGVNALFTDGNGTYWFRTVGRYTQAVEETLGSLEYLTDEIRNTGSDAVEDDGLNYAALGAMYRRTTRIYEDL
ncbi:MAG: ATP-dependent RNA helicase [Spirochaetaceae bacterium]|nr:MAG: ATP-dependent RNA helicase [Spirochaetaceae bacterium]